MSVREGDLFWTAVNAPTYAEAGEAINRLLDAHAHELAEKTRAGARGPCVNDTNGDGDCAACARNPEALCRPLRSAEQLADLIDPEVQGAR